MQTSRLRKRMPVTALTDPKIIVPAIGAAFGKLDPRSLIKNPVMFVVEVVALLATILFIRDLAIGGANLDFTFQIILWLWFTLLFANFAEAVAEGRGKAQAATLRQTREETTAKLIVDEKTGLTVPTPASELAPGQIVLVEVGDLIPSDGEVIEGVASGQRQQLAGRAARGPKRWSGEVAIKRPKSSKIIGCCFFAERSVCKPSTHFRHGRMRRRHERFISGLLPR